MLTSVSAEASETFLPQSGLNSGSVCQLTGVCGLWSSFQPPCGHKQGQSHIFLEAKCKL